MRVNQRSLYALSALILCSTLAAQAQSGVTEVSSPDHRITLRFAVQQSKPKGDAAGQTSVAGPDGQLVYSVDFRGKPVLDASALRLELVNQPALGAAVHITGSKPESGVDDYTLLAGKTSAVRDAYNAINIQLTETASASRSFSVEARVYNNAIAFRYHVPQQPALARYQLVQEDTEFRASTDATAWSLRLPNYQSGYESEYTQQVLSALSNQGGISSYILNGAPMLLHLPGTAWAAIAEADLEGNAAMYLENPSGNWGGHYVVSKISPAVGEMTLRTEESKSIELSAKDPSGLPPAIDAPLPHNSAWRVVLIGDTPGDLMEANVITDLNPENRVADTSWIHPGKASWDWWNGDIGADDKPAFTTETMKYYVDFAAASGFPYFMLDAGWSKGRDITAMNGKVDIPELVSYAEKKHVKVWIWLYSKSVAAQMEPAFSLYEKWGVAGVKIDFIQRNDQQGIQWYYDVAKSAAAHHLMVDFHGATQPWGIERTYPNVLNYESVLGMENNKAGRRDSPVDRTVFPFTRMLDGPLDYTPGGFDNVTEDEFVARGEHPMVMGTRAQQLALYVVYEAPFEMVSDTPAAYSNQPDFQFLRDVPASWDATRVIGGEPGEFVAIARRHGSEWYLGSITNWTARTVPVSLSFLNKGAYTAEIYEDAADASKNPKHTVIRKQQVHSGDTLELHLAKGGGCAIRFVPSHS